MSAKYSIAKRILGACLVLALGLGAAPAWANKKIVLRGITPWTADYDLSRAFFIFEELVKERLGDRVEIRYLGGPEVSDPNDQFSALRNGVVDVMLGAAAYYRSDVPLAAAVQFTSRKPSELRTSGYQYRDDLSEHRNLMEQVLDHNLSGLLQASEAHIRGTYDVVLKVLANSEQQTH